MDWLFIGLGNPGPSYDLTRHNTGFWMAEMLAEHLGFSFSKPWFQNYLWARGAVGTSPWTIVKPLTYMNRSGYILPYLQKKTKIPPSRTLILVDQMDLPPGKLRLKVKGSHAGHNGLRSIEAFLGTEEYPRLYIGIGRPQKESVLDHVLGVPMEEEGRRILSALKQIPSIFESLKTRGIEELIGAVNGITP